jgi:hypothetical protein
MRRRSLARAVRRKRLRSCRSRPAAVPDRCRTRRRIRASLTLKQRGKRATELRTVIASAIPRSIRLEKSMHALVENRATVKILPETIEKRITAVDNAMTAT